ncbi:MAG TPA: hypothetical protein VGU46_09330 [Acidobacteriaceae bacterium]|nr:hypothetical protein [Acidobacteriaceae bacterium]
MTFAVGMALVGVLLWGIFQGPLRASMGPPFYLVVDAILTLPLGFLAWHFGTFGIGHDLSWGSGSFLFSRPRTRAFFVWSDWGYGMAQLMLLVLAAKSVLALTVERGSGPILLAGGQVSLFLVFCLHLLAGLLLTGLLFGLTYLCSVLVKQRGSVLSIGVVLAYLIAKSVVKHYWPGIILPDLTLTEFSASHSGAPAFADQLMLSIALRTALVVAFPLAAQLLVQRRDVD